MNTVTYGSGTADDPWKLKTPPLTSEFLAWRDETEQPHKLDVQVGTTKLSYHLRCIEDLHAMLTKHNDWMPLGNADEGKPVTPGTVEAWGAQRIESGGRVLRHPKGLPRPLRQLRSACPRVAWDGGTRTPATQQSRSRDPEITGYKEPNNVVVLDSN